MSRFTAILDANVLYPGTLRDILIRLALTGSFQARWSDRILDEMFRNLHKNRPDIPTEKLQRTRYLMCQAVEDCLVNEHEGLIEGLSLPDPDDRHVLAAAIQCNARIIVTENKRDFPLEITHQHGIDVQNANEFLCYQIALSQPNVHQAVVQAAAALKNPPRTINDVLHSLAKSGAPTAAALLKQ
ncbi:PIN domain-containing protein [Corynebacterium sp. 22KM0430]|uniref:PIN domain-containing protein n=1 Tax=Corynebacterium sp. 22KM0430 TaxID=2989735 RepID=UPI0029C9C58B|nr:PIN domain-containing protein [Corynebacterium sp. 22KM0430]WPF65998.1 PIN domain-containing protein [Corynebacterium sp. 22KM0430]